MNGLLARGLFRGQLDADADERRAPPGHRAPARQGDERRAGRGADAPRRARRSRRSSRRTRSSASTWPSCVGRRRAATHTTRSTGATRPIACASRRACASGQARRHARARRSSRFGARDARRVPLETGRTHQIRVHLAESGTPILGDPLYGKPPRDAALRARSPSARPPGAPRAPARLRSPDDGRGACASRRRRPADFAGRSRRSRAGRPYRRRDPVRRDDVARWTVASFAGHLLADEPRRAHGREPRPRRQSRGAGSRRRSVAQPRVKGEHASGAPLRRRRAAGSSRSRRCGYRRRHVPGALGTRSASAGRLPARGALGRLGEPRGARVARTATTTCARGGPRDDGCARRPASRRARSPRPRSARPGSS